MCNQLITSLIIIFFFKYSEQNSNNNDNKYSIEVSDLHITVNARNRLIELSWRNFNNLSNYIVMTNENRINNFETVEDNYDAKSTGSYSTTTDSILFANTSTDATESIEVDDNENETETIDTRPVGFQWTYSVYDGTATVRKDVLFAIKPIYTIGWTRTNIEYDYSLMNSLDVTVSCYGYFVYFINENGTILSEYCLKIYPTWMNDLKKNIQHFRVRELFIPGTHDSASYKEGFDYRQNDNLVTKYSLTQDYDIRGQLMMGVRYIDIRVGYYRAAEPVFWANHGISRQHPLTDILRQIRGFALETNEIIIVDVQEFPIGFGRNFEIHKKLINLISTELADVMADPSIGWEAPLEEIWKQQKNVILSYDYERAVYEFPHLLWNSVEQKWGNVQGHEDLKKYLFRIHKHSINNYSTRPIADMAELTPDPWSVITDRYGGLRKMADGINRYLTKWYFEELGPTANIVAVDFIRGTNIVEAAIYWNLKREVQTAD